jgi:hypothetical protein
MTREEADRLVENDRVRTTTNCVSIQWDGRVTPEIYTVDDMGHISRVRKRK